VHGILIAALGVLAGPEAAPLLEPVFGGTLPGWATTILKAAGLLYAAYGRATATAQISGVVTKADTVEIPIERRA
jgi:hypothetical protein